MITILDKDLESVIAEATKLQHRVLESIIGESHEVKEVETSEETVETGEIMTAAEESLREIKIHKSEKETFSKGIASIIYNKMEGNEQNLAVDEGYDDSKEDGECSEERNNVIEEIAIKTEKIEVSQSKEAKVTVSSSRV